MHFSVSGHEKNPNPCKERFRKGGWRVCALIGLEGSGGGKSSGPEIPATPKEHHMRDLGNQWGTRGHGGASDEPRRRSWWTEEGRISTPGIWPRAGLLRCQQTNKSYTIKAQLQRAPGQKIFKTSR